MTIDLAIQEAMSARPDAVAVACMDTRSGFVLGLQVRGDVAPDDVELATLAATQMCSAPSPDGAPDEIEACEASFVVSDRWVHAYARVPHHAEWVVVGLAPGDANIALLRAWVRQLAERVAPRA